MEELVLKIQQGHTELYSDLWEEIKGLIAWWARRFFAVNSAYGISLGLEWMTPQNNKRCIDDLVQSGFFGLVDAVEHYDPEKGSFTTLLKYYLLKAFQEATTGRSIKQKKDPMLWCRSLDEHVGDEDSDTILLDLIPDERNDIAEADEKIFTEQLHVALDAALGRLPEMEAAAIRKKYYENKSLEEIGTEFNCSTSNANLLCNRGLNHIRFSSDRRRLEQFLDENTSYYKGMGMSSYRQTNTSGVERWVLRRDQMRKTYDKLINEGSHKMEHTTVGFPEDLSNKFDLPITKKPIENPEEK